MAVDMKHAEQTQDPSVTTLVTGIISDAQDLMKQQFELLKHEVREDLRKARDAGLTLGVSIGCGFVGAILMGMMLAHLLAWAAPTLPLWACFGITGIVILAVASGCYYATVKQVETITPPKETAQTLKENVQWITNPK